MSSNDYVLVKWRKGSYHVTHRDMETNEVQVKIGNAKKIGTALKIANDYLEKNNVEYGLTVVPRI